MAQISQEEFHKTYKTKIEPLLADLEADRVTVAKKSKPFIALVIISLFLFLLCAFILKSDNAKVFAVIFFITGILFYWPIYSMYSKLRDKLKQNIISKIFKMYGNMYFSGKKDIITAYEIRKMGLFPRFASKSDDDIVIGIHKNCNFVISETRLTHTEKRGKSTTTVTDFGGLIVKIQMNKKFAGQTIIGMKGFIQKPGNNFEEVKLESVDFMKSRKVYATDQIEARYILTTSFIERIEALGDVFHHERSKNTNSTFEIPKTGIDFVDNMIGSAYVVSAGFVDGYVYLFVPTEEDFFEIPANKSLYNENLYYNICTELDSILGIIEYLHIDQKTGL